MSIDGLPMNGLSRHRAIGVWLALLALIFNALAVQSHVHPHQCRPGASQEMAGPSVGCHAGAYDARQPAPPAPEHCPLCQQLAHGTAYLPPESLLAQLPRAISLPASGFIAGFLPRPLPSHHWSSRAPPRP